MDNSLRFAKFELKLPAGPSQFGLSGSIDELISYELPRPKTFELEYNSVASYEDLKRLSSFFDSDNEDSFPTSTATASAKQGKNSSSLDGDDIDPAMKELKVGEMVKLTLAPKDMCLFHLESMNWNVTAAVKSYYECLR